MEDTSRGTIRAKEIRSKKDSYFRREERFLRSSYNAKTVNKKVKGRHKKQVLLLMQDNFLLTKEYVDLKLKERWSPEQISNKLRKLSSKHDLTKHELVNMNYLKVNHLKINYFILHIKQYINTSTYLTKRDI